MVFGFAASQMLSERRQSTKIRDREAFSFWRRSKGTPGKVCGQFDGQVTFTGETCAVHWLAESTQDLDRLEVMRITAQPVP